MEFGVVGVHMIWKNGERNGKQESNGHWVNIGTHKNCTGPKCLWFRVTEDDQKHHRELISDHGVSTTRTL